MAFSQGIGWGIGRHRGRAIEKDFIMKVDTTIAGDLPDNQFLLRTHGNEVFQGNNFNVKTSDGQEFNNITAPTLTITFPSPGVYTLRISGKFSGTKYDFVTEGNKIIDILNWGDWEELQWARARQSFRDCRSLTTFSAKDAPYLGNIDSLGLREMFYNCNALNADFSKWDVSPISDFGSTFGRCTVFNNPSLNNWDMSGATLVDYMFQEADAFNQDLSAWDVSLVTTMLGMFDSANEFNGNVSTWNTSSLTGSLFRLFSRTSFNGDLSNWDVSGVTSLDNTFAYSPFNNNSISNWDVSNVSNFRATFVGTSFNQDLSNWDTGMALRMDSMFSSSGFDSASIGNWNVSNVSNMAFMFYNCVFNKDISSWDVSSVTTMQGMFQDRGTKTNSAVNISGWTTSSLVNTYQMFRGFGSNVQDLSNWDMSNVTDARGMFEFGGMTFDLSRWDIQGAVNLQGLLNQASNTSGVVGLWTFNNWNVSQAVSITSMLGSNVITTAAYDATLIAWAAQVPTTVLTLNVNSTQYTLGGEAEAARTALINTYGWTITDGGGIAGPFTFTVDTALNGGNGSGIAFQLPLVSTSTVNATVDWGDGTVNTVTAYNDPNALHAYASSGVYNISISGTLNGWSCAQAPIHSNDSRKITNISNWGCFDVTETGAFANAINMSGTATDYPAISGGTLASMFSNCYLWNCPMDQWDVSGVTNMNSMFFSARAFNQPLNSWNVSNVGDMGNMFRTTITGAFNQPLNNWDVSNVTEMISMFAFNNSFNGDITSWQLTSNPRIQSMFDGASAFNQPIVNWDIDGIVAATWLFRNASSFDQNLGNWIIRTISSFDWFTGGGLSTGNYDSTLIGWASQAPNIPFNKSANFGSSQYTLGSAAETARTSLINTYGWTIIDGGGVLVPSYVYSVYDITGNATNSIMISNDSLSEIDIPFNAGFIDTSLITSHSSGNYSTVTTFYDQVGGSDLTESTKIYQPRITDASGTSLTYLDDYAERVGLNNLTNYESYDLTGDFIFQYVMNDETQVNNGRQNFSHVKTGNNISVGFRSAGASYIIGITVDSVNLPNRWVVAKPSQFALYTFTRISGVYNLYINNVLQVSDGGVESVLGAETGITLGYRAGQASGKINDVQTFSALYNNDLSAFDVSAYNTTYMNIHGL